MNREQAKGLRYSDYFKNHQKTDVIDGLMTTNSKNSGAKVLFVGGIHGDETAPLAAMIKLYKTFLAKPELLKKGEISYLLANPKAAEATKKFIDGNLNRLFGVDNNNTNYEEKRAKEINEYILKNQDFSVVLDLHTVTTGEFRLVIFNKKQSESVNFLEKTSDISYFASYENVFIPNTFMSIFNNLEIPAYGIECGNNKSIKSISVAFDQMVKTLEYFDMIEKDSIPLMAQFTKSEYMQIFDIRKSIQPHPDFSYVDPNIKTGSLIKKGQIYATYKNGYHISHEDMTVLLPKENPKKSDPNAGFLTKVYRLKR